MLLFVSVFLIAACGLVYELVAGTLASYLLGDSVTQFSTVIGSYLFAMGLGSALSRLINRGLVYRFVWVELAVGLVGGFSSAALFLSFAYTQAFRLILYVVVVLIGVLVGLEIPLLIRILKDRFQLRDVVAHVLSVDYLGALVASIVFPFVLVPELGLVRAALMFGLINAAVALWATFLFAAQLGRLRGLRAACVIVLLALGFGMTGARRITAAADESLYADEVIMARDSRYQRIVLTRWKDDIRLFLNSKLQFSSRDEYRYHEALVHPGLAALPWARHILVLGGGDGLALREILKYPQVESVTLVDLDPEVTRLFSSNPMLTALNQDSFHSSKVRVINADAFSWLDQDADMFDFAVVDFPDPNSYALGKLYTVAFYRLLAKHLSRDGLFVVQSTSPLFARQSYWCIVASLKAAGLQTYPYHVYVPSFGEWGFVIAGNAPYHLPAELPSGLRFLSVPTLPEMFEFPNDMQPVAAQPNRLNDQTLVHYYEGNWGELTH